MVIYTYKHEPKQEGGGGKSPKTTSPKGFSASKCDVGNWIFSKS